MTFASQTSRSRRNLVAFCAAAALGCSAFPALAQGTAWPSKPIRLVVGFAPGGTTDVIARVLAQSIAETLGQPVLVDNKPGASGNIAAAEVSRAAPDGYTFLVAPTSVETANPSLFKSSLVPSRDLTPVAGVGRTQMYLISKPTLPVKDVPELIALAKAEPGKLTFATSGAGTPMHLAAELFKQNTHTFITHIPYRGSGPALADLMGGQVDINWDSGVSFPLIKSGKVKLLAVASDRKSPFFPDAPTFADLGIRNASLDIWFGVWAPNNTPPEATARLARELSKALALPTVKQRFGDLGAESASLEPAAFKKLLTDEAKTLSTLIKDRAIAPE